MKAGCGDQAIDDGQGISTRFGDSGHGAPARGDFEVYGQQSPLESTGEVRADPGFQLLAS